MLSLLGICSWQDLKRKELAVQLLLGFGVIGVFLHVYFRELSLGQMLGGMILGLLVMLLAVVTKGHLGLGDGILLLITGIFLGFWRNLELILGAAILAGVVSAYLLVIKKVDKNYEIPFAPFILVMYVLSLGFEMIVL